MKNLSHIFKALADETRLRIMALLLNGKELCVCDIMEALDLPQSTVSRHLSYLRNAGLVDDRRHGVWMYYQLRREEMMHADAIHELLSLYFEDLDQVRLDRRRLRKHLAAKKPETCT